MRGEKRGETHSSSERVNGGEKALPEVAKQRPVNALQCRTSARVDRQVELSDRRQARDCIWELRVGHKEAADAARVQQCKKLVDARVKDGLADERKCTMPHAVERVVQPLREDAGHSAELADHLRVLLEDLHIIHMKTNHFILRYCTVT